MSPATTFWKALRYASEPVTSIRRATSPRGSMARSRVWVAASRTASSVWRTCSRAVRARPTSSERDVIGPMLRVSNGSASSRLMITVGPSPRVTLRGSVAARSMASRSEILRSSSASLSTPSLQ